MAKVSLADGRGRLELKYLVEDVDRHGNVRLYVKRRGCRKVRLRSPPGSREFLAEYQEAIAGKTATKSSEAAEKTARGSLRWLIEEVHQYEARHPIGTKARLALALLLFTGQRRSDVVRFGRQHVKSGWLTFTQAKNQNRKPITLSIPILPELQAVLDATPSTNMNFLVTEFGKPFTSNGFGNRFRKWCDEAELLHVSAHGLRKAGAVIAAENGATERQLMAIFGWSTMKEAARYTRAARQKVLAASAMPLLISGQRENK